MEQIRSDVCGFASRYFVAPVAATVSSRNPELARWSQPDVDPDQRGGDGLIKSM
jgi:hypothetical protein